MKSVHGAGSEEKVLRERMESDGEAYELAGHQPGLAVRTFLVFLDLPYHYEFSVGTWPLFTVGTEIGFNVRLSNPKSPSRVREVSGPYRVTRSKLEYSTKRPGRMGLSQYLELLPAAESLG